MIIDPHSLARTELFCCNLVNLAFIKVSTFYQLMNDLVKISRDLLDGSMKIMNRIRINVISSQN